MKTTHTPGPWTCSEDSSVYRSVFPFVLGPGGELICNMNKIPRAILPHERANARLIAAAPDLLEALEDAVEHLKHLLPDEILEPHRHAIARALEG